MHVKRDSLGDFYIFIVTDLEKIKPDYAASSKSVGMDFETLVKLELRLYLISMNAFPYLPYQMKYRLERYHHYFLCRDQHRH